MADTPFIKYGLSNDAKRLYFSEPKAARKIPRTVQAGYGILVHGLLMALNTSAAGNKGKLVPYDPDAVTGAEVAPCRAYLVADSGTANKTIEITLEDSYKFAIGDDVILNDDTTTAENLGAITDIDRTTYPHKAVITVTTNIGGTAFTTARFAYITVEGAETAVGVLEKSVDTLSGEGCLAANTTLILGNAVLYAGVVANADAAGLTDIGANTVSQFINIP